MNIVMFMIRSLSIVVVVCLIMSECEYLKLKLFGLKMVFDE